MRAMVTDHRTQGDFFMKPQLIRLGLLTLLVLQTGIIFAQEETSETTSSSAGPMIIMLLVGVTVLIGVGGYMSRQGQEIE